MYRLRRRRKLQRRRRATVVTAAIAVLALAIGVPTLASANGVDGLLDNIGIGGGGGGGVSGGDTASPTPESGAPPTYVPPLHGTNPHGQGTDAVVDLAPSPTNPVGVGIPDSGEDIVAGDSRGEQNEDGTYHGTVTAANILGITIPDLLTIETNPGETKDGALQPLNDALADLCTASTGQLCLTVLGMHSSTTSTGSSNSFTGANVSVGGPTGINAAALESNGDISSDGTCQTSTGHSRVVGAGVGGPTGSTANVAEGDSTSQACNNGQQSVQQSSSVIGLAGAGIPVPAAGCDDGTPNVVFDALSPLVATECNADDSNAGQTSDPYGVREALTVFALITGGEPLLKLVTAGPESHAVAPPPATTPQTPVSPATPPAGQGPGNQGNKGNKGNGNNGNGNGNGAGGAGAAAGAAAAGNGQLAFTGADLLVLGLVGGALILGGLALTTTAGRRHRRTV